MTTTNPPVPPAFPNDDFAARMRRVVSSAAESGLAGVIVTPGWDLVWLTGYRPTAITERLTMLVLPRTKSRPCWFLSLSGPTLRLLRARAACAGCLGGRHDPYEIAGPLLRPDGQFGISDSAWACICWGCSGCCRGRATGRSRRVCR